MTSIVYTNQRSRKKPANTAKSRQLAAEWDAIKNKWNDTNTTKKMASRETLSTSYLSIPAGRSTSHIASVGSGVGNAALKPSPVYTGDAMVGIAQMAKSNAVPVFNFDHIDEIAHMRR